MSRTVRHAWLQPFLSTTLWTLVLIDIAVMTYLENQDFFKDYAGWAWPSVLITGIIGYFIGPAIDRLFSRKSPTPNSH
ncbi:hypothetical protein [Gluconobacter oxydans]|uniref:hypothetical protein n=1 Tax=Gluconobacter oxydans TaxID=442 RepID=UPI001CD90EFA|nr:hypothetical protein [Gluconobacter oxydans]